jgi:hypothetical protein
MQFSFKEQADNSNLNRDGDEVFARQASRFTKEFEHPPVHGVDAQFDDAAIREHLLRTEAQGKVAQNPHFEKREVACEAQMPHAAALAPFALEGCAEGALAFAPQFFAIVMGRSREPFAA